MAMERRQNMEALLGFDAEVAKHGWEKEGLNVPGTRNFILPNVGTPHGFECPVCMLAPDVSVDSSVKNHMNTMLEILRACRANSADADAVAAMISSYWEVNVRTPRLENGERDCGKMTPELMHEHIRTLVPNGKESGSKSARNAEAWEDLIMAHAATRNKITGATGYDHNACQDWIKLVATKRLIHETDWLKSRLGQYGPITPETLEMFGPLLKLYNS